MSSDPKKKTVTDAEKVAQEAFQAQERTGPVQPPPDDPLLNEILAVIGPQHPTEVEFWHDIVKTVPQQEILAALKKIRALDATVKYPGTLLYHLIQSRRK